MKTLKTREIIKTLAKENGISSQEVEEVISTYFEFIRHVQSELLDREANYFPSVRLSNFAIFYIPEAMQERFKIINNSKNESD
jgi:nucleoid DNA-binding protein